MIASLFPFLIYLTLLVVAIFLAWVNTGAKRKVILKRFKLDESHMKAIRHADPMLKSLAILDWSMAFVFAGVLLSPAVVFGNSIWLEIPILELVFLILGILVVKYMNITDWYMECFLVNFRSYWSSLILTFAAILIVNAAYAVDTQHYGLAAWLVAMLLMTFSLLMLISPILKEWRFYSEAGLNDWIDFIKTRHEKQEGSWHAQSQ